MEIKKFTTYNGFSVNCYLVIKDGSAILIDTGFDYSIIEKYLQDNNINLLGVFITHGHYDHIYSAKKFKDAGYKIFVHSLDADKLNSDNNLGKQFDCPIEYTTCTQTVEEGMLKIGDFEIQVLHTPGHSKGSVCYIIEDCIFFGDTIFEKGYGRYDFYDGNFTQLRNSIRKLMPYIKDEKYKKYYGHD